VNVLDWVRHPGFEEDEVWVGGKHGQLESFKDAYIILKHLGHLGGLWRVIGEGKEGRLVVFQWVPSGIIGHQLSFVADSGVPEHTIFCNFTPTMDILKNVEWEVGYEKVAVRADDVYSTPERSTCRSTSPAMSTPHHRSTEAAEVGFGTPRSISSRDSPIYGASPENSFRHAWSQFMSSSVQTRRSKMRRRSSRHTMQFSNLKHLQRVVIPKETKRHPLAGLWVVELEDDMFEVVSLSYNFRSQVAVIMASKLSGHGCLAPGETIWKIRAATSTDWSVDEIDMYNRMVEFGDFQRGTSSASGDLETFELEMQQLSLGQPARFTDGHPDVLWYHTGNARYFGPDDEDDEDMVACRLYVFSQDTIALFFNETNEVYTLRRVVL